ncbi:hypothetical protein [Halobaculum sp. EA56]|uniref:hypothetical protein n=1 Tax=Halobaculum sp. EA56 TaxID=3421648 RepID=UPI003EBD57A1
MTIAVSRSAPGDLAEGAETKLRRADAVEAVESLDIRGLQPGLNDLTVEADATVSLAGEAGESREAVADALAAQFGVDDVTVAAVRSVPPDAGDQAAAPVGE